MSMPIFNTVGFCTQVFYKLWKYCTKYNFLGKVRLEELELHLICSYCALPYFCYTIYWSYIVIAIVYLLFELLRKRKIEKVWRLLTGKLLLYLWLGMPHYKYCNIVQCKKIYIIRVRAGKFILVDQTYYYQIKDIVLLVINLLYAAINFIVGFYYNSTIVRSSSKYLFHITNHRPLLTDTLR